jgi:hypothetical protein
MNTSSRPKMGKVCTSNSDMNPKDVPNKRIISSKSLRDDRLLNYLNCSKNNDSKSLSDKSEKKANASTSKPNFQPVLIKNSGNPLIKEESKRGLKASSSLSFSDQKSSLVNKTIAVNPHKEMNSMISRNNSRLSRSNIIYNPKNCKLSKPEKDKNIDLNSPIEDVSGFQNGSNDLSKSKILDDLSILTNVNSKSKRQCNLGDEVTNSKWVSSILRTVAFNKKIDPYILSNKIRFKAKLLMRKVNSRSCESFQIFRANYEEVSVYSPSKISSKKIKKKKLNNSKESIKISILEEMNESRSEFDNQAQNKCAENILEKIEDNLIQNQKIEETDFTNMVKICEETNNSIGNTRTELRSISKDGNEFYSYKILINRQNNQILNSRKISLRTLFAENPELVFQFLTGELWKVKGKYEDFMRNFYIFAHKISEPHLSHN